MDHLDGFLRAVRSDNLWYSFDDVRTYTNEEVEQMKVDGRLNLNMISAIPDRFPVVGDMFLAYNVFIPCMENALAMRANKPTSCYRNLFGPLYRSASCFMDSTLMAMFAVKGSPFTENMLAKQLDLSQAPTACDWDDINSDHTKRQNIFESLRGDIGPILSGSDNKVCSRLRRFIGRECRTDPRMDDFRGSSDPLEFYQRLCAALNYFPMVLESRNFWALTPEGDGEQQSSTHNEHASILPSIRIVGHQGQRIETVWPGPFSQKVYEFQERGWEENRDFKWRSNDTAVNRADAIVVHINRRDPNRTQYVSTKQVRVYDEMFVPVGNVQERYILRSAVYSFDEGHYTSYIRCGNQWYLYNDTQVKPKGNNRKGETFALMRDEHMVDHKEVMITLSRRGALLFYFKATQ